MLKAGFRYGDDAPMAVIELVDRDPAAKGQDSGPTAEKTEAGEEEQAGLTPAPSGQLVKGGLSAALSLPRPVGRKSGVMQGRCPKAAAAPVWPSAGPIRRAPPA